MKILAKIIKDNRIADIPVEHDLGIQIEHDLNVYTLNIDNHGKLILRNISGDALIIKPESANSVEIKSE